MRLDELRWYDGALGKVSQRVTADNGRLGAVVEARDGTGYWLGGHLYRDLFELAVALTRYTEKPEPDADQ
jgi:hypothetical protein